MNTLHIRLAVLVLAVACTIFWLAVARQSVADAIPLAKGVRLGLWTTLVFLFAVSPALILAVCNVALRVALALAVLGALVYGAVFVAYLPVPAMPGSVTWLTALLVVVLGGTYALFGLPFAAEPEATFEQSQLRLATLYVAAVATVVWLTSFVPAIQYAGRGKGFEVIPAMLATLVYVPFVIPLLVIGLHGGESRYPDLRWGVLFVTLVTSGIFGVPQLIA